jgi:hypothetical protein
MTFMTGDQNLLSADARGRGRVPVERREALLDELEHSQAAHFGFVSFRVILRPAARNVGGSPPSDSSTGPGRPHSLIAHAQGVSPFRGVGRIRLRSGRTRR